MSCTVPGVRTGPPLAAASQPRPGRRLRLISGVRLARWPASIRSPPVTKSPRRSWPLGVLACPSGRYGSAEGSKKKSVTFIWS